MPAPKKPPKKTTPRKTTPEQRITKLEQDLKTVTWLHAELSLAFQVFVAVVVQEAQQQALLQQRVAASNGQGFHSMLAQIGNG